jgi:ABC-type branched-subunit amino acid transport system ATPase component
MSPAPVLRTQGLRLAQPGRGDGCLDLVLAPGELCTVQTPTVEAATALARTVLGLQPAASGRVELFGQDLATLSERSMLRLRRGTTLLHAREGDGLFPAWSAIDNLTLAWLQCRNPVSIERQQVRRELQDQARRYGIVPQSLDEPVARRSRADRLALSLWRALLSRPSLVVVDGQALEPHLFATDFALDRLLADACTHAPALLVLGTQAATVPSAWPCRGPVQHLTLGETLLLA